MAIDPYANCNAKTTFVDTGLCTLETCCLAQGAAFEYLPSYGGNIFFTVFFGLIIIPNLYFGIRHKTWGYMVGMVAGSILEVLGYASRVMMHDNPFDGNAFLLYIITNTIAPVFYTAAVYLCISRLFIVYGQHSSRVAPKWVAVTFMTIDFLSLVLQAAGGAIADIADPGTSLQDTGINTMISGLILQAVGLTFFLTVCADFAFRCKNGVLDMTPEKVATRNRLFFKGFIASLMLATMAILIRSIFRVVELWQGFSGELWNNELDFMILDGAMIALASICLTALHPGPVFRGQWAAANWNFRSKKNKETGIPMKGARSEES